MKPKVSKLAKEINFHYKNEMNDYYSIHNTLIGFECNYKGKNYIITNGDEFIKNGNSFVKSFINMIKEEFST